MNLTEKQIKRLKNAYNSSYNGNCCVASMRQIFDILGIDVENIKDDAFLDYDYSLDKDDAE